MNATGLRCEYRVNPLGIDAQAPRLSWVLESAERGQVQTAWRVLVASTPAKLEADQGDLWDSGKVTGGESALIVYGGQRLQSRQRCYWKVRAWDGEGRPTAWSAAALWTMGLLEAQDWRGEWIGLPAIPPERGDSLAGAGWIWIDGDGVTPGAQPGRTVFRRVFDLPADRKIAEAIICVTADDEYMGWINGYRCMRGSNVYWGEAQDIKARLQPGRNVIAIQANNVGETRGPAGMRGRLEIRFESGDPLVILTDRQWRASPPVTRGMVAPGEPPEVDWRGVEYDDSGWSEAAELGAEADAHWGEIPNGMMYLPPARYLRREFATQQPVERAMLHATALGIYEIHLNGHRVGDDFLSPGWSDYAKRIHYRTHDVTELMREGGNAIGALLADGWYSGYIALGAQRHQYGIEPLLKAQLEIEYADGTTETVATDSRWRGATGAMREADLLMGETLDAQLEPSGWDETGFDASQWGDVILGEGTGAPLEAHPGPPVRLVRELTPVSVTQPKPGVWVFDLGQNFAGTARLWLKKKQPAGTKIVLRYAERLNPEGTLYTENLRQARATDTYVCSGVEGEVWQPRFTFHGFQYVEVAGLRTAPDVETVTGIPLSSDTPSAGSFSSSDPVANKLFSNIQWTQRANFIDIPTDCPQRDERLGWTGDAQIYMRTATYLNDVATFFAKWLTDLDDAQTTSGAFPDVAPRKGAMGLGVAGWADAGVICPWTFYQVYGDTVELGRHYEAMGSWIEYCRAGAIDLIRPNEGYGDWLNIDDDTPRDLLGTAYFAYSTQLMAESARALGKQADAAKYDDLFHRICAAFQREFIREDGRLKTETQTGYVLALHFGLLPEEERAEAAARLVELIEGRGWRLSTGFLGTKDLMGTLTEIGRADVAYRLFENDTFPSWRFSIKQGATSIWERWDGWTPEKGFQTPQMNSFAHYSFGAVAQWMFETIGGIEPTQPGFGSITLHPRPGGTLDWATVEYDSIRGPIRSAWRVEEGRFNLKVTIPANVTATIVLPTKGPDEILEGGRPLTASEGIRGVEKSEDGVRLAVGSGTYDFDLPITAERLAILRP